MAATMSKKVMLTAKQALINLIPQRPGGHLTIRGTPPLKIHLDNSQSHCQTDKAGADPGFGQGGGPSFRGRKLPT